MFKEFASKLVFEVASFLPSAHEQELADFRSRNNVVLPADLENFFLLFHATAGGWDDDTFTKFYTISEVGNVVETYGDYGGIPDYRNIVNTLPDVQHYYVFADHSINVLGFAIRLYPEPTPNNEIVVICGDKYRTVASSISDFIDKYLIDPYDLFI